jgi:hypothetical protein
MDGATHLITHDFDLAPPHPNMVLHSVVLVGWGDDTSEWWWDGTLLSFGGQGWLGEHRLPVELFDSQGGVYRLAIRTRNAMPENVDEPHTNPHGTAYVLRVLWQCQSCESTIHMPVVAGG